MNDYLILGAEFLLLIVLVAGSAFFSSAEMSLFSLSRAKILAAKDSPKASVRRIFHLMDNYNRTLVTIILSNMFVNSGISMLNDSVITQLGLSGALKMTVSALSAVVILLLFGEITPMTLAYTYCDRWSKVVSSPITFLRFVLTPATFVIDRLCKFVLNLLGRSGAEPLTHDEYESYLDSCEKSGAFTKNETELLKSAIDFCEREIDSVMQSRMSVGYVLKDFSGAQVLDMIRKTRRRYLIVCSKSVDDADTILSTRDFFMLPPFQRENWLKSSCVRQAEFLPENTSVINALHTLHESGNAAALVTDEYGVVSGLVSRHDICQSIAGAVSGNDLASELIAAKVGDDVWDFNGLTPLEVVAETTGYELDELYKSATLNGVYCEISGEVPRPSAEVSDGSMTLKILDVTKNRASKIRLSLPGRCRV